MASAIKSALPTHLKPNSGDEQGNERRHGKTRSHMVS
jgi:UTP--glucose-1-phosphate uridylyltransferase